jgi:hypothetical protein
MNPLVYTPRVYENPSSMPSPLAPILKRKPRRRCACRRRKKPNENAFHKAIAYVLCLFILTIVIRLSIVR